MNNEYAYMTANNLNPSSQKRRIIIAILALVVGTLVIVGIAMFTRQLNTGVIEASSESQADISLVSNKDNALLGKGKVKARVTPGTYQIVASNNDAKTFRTITVEKRKTTTVQLGLEKIIPLQRLSDINGHTILPKGDTLYFVKSDTKTLYSYTPSTSIGRPYATYADNLVDVRWLTPTTLFARDAINDWMYVVNGEQRPLTFEKKSMLPLSFSANAAGAYAFVSSENELVTADSPTTTPHKLEELEESRNVVTSIAPNKTVLVAQSELGEDDVTVPTKLYHDGKTDTIGEKEPLFGLNNAIWAPDSSKFSFTRPEGLFVYTVTTKEIQQILFTQPTHPSSVLWLSATQFMYAHENELWRYDTTNKTSVKLANFSGTIEASRPFSLSDDTTYIYFGTNSEEAGNTGGGIYRLMPSFNSLSESEQKAASNTQPIKPALLFSGSGIGDLLEYGVTEDQIENLRYAIGQFVRTTHPQAEEVFINNINVVDRDRESTSDDNTATFQLTVVKSAIYNARLTYSGLTSIRLSITDANSKQVYNSNVIDSRF